MKTALVLGGARCLSDDIDAFKRLRLKHHGVVACNDAGWWWPKKLDAWVSLHPEKFGPWREKRAQNGYRECKRLYGHRSTREWVEQSDHKFPGQTRTASSGGFAAKVALIDLGYDRVVLCGVPLDKISHFFNVIGWRDAETFRRGFLEIPQEYRCRMRSMSGWTGEVLGSPQDWVKEAA